MKRKRLLSAVLYALALPLVFSGVAGAVTFAPDGAVQNATTGVWEPPADQGACFDGTATIDASYANRLDCIANASSTLSAISLRSVCQTYVQITSPAGYDLKSGTASWGRCSNGTATADQATCEGAGGTWEAFTRCSKQLTNAQCAQLGTDLSIAVTAGGTSTTPTCTTTALTATQCAAGGTVSTIPWMGSAAVSGATTTCTLYIGNDATACAAVGGGTISTTNTDETRGNCFNAWVFKQVAGDGATATTTGTDGSLTTVQARACLRCHNTKYQGAGSVFAEPENYIYGSHKNASRKITPNAKWAQVHMNGTTETFGVFDYAKLTNNSTNPVVPDAIDWVNGTLGGKDWFWYWGYYFEDPIAGSDVVADEITTTTGGGIPTRNMSGCALCHATGFTAENSVLMAKEPGKTWGSTIHWDGSTTYTSDSGKVNLKNQYNRFNELNGGSTLPSSADCTALGGTLGTACTTTALSESACRAGGSSIPGATPTWGGGWTGSWASATSTCTITYAWKYNSWDEFGVLCSNCHNAVDGGHNNSATGTRKNVPRPSVAQPAYGAQVNAVCLQCHAKASSGTGVFTTGTGGNIAARSATTTGHPNYHGNQFMNSPHARFNGSITQVTDTTKYSSAFATTNGGCEGCHNPHGSVRENLLDPTLMGTAVAEEGLKTSCVSCHATYSDANTIAVSAANVNHRTGVGTPDCMTCHMPGGQHLFRIDVANNPNAADDTGYTEAAWTPVVTGSRSACGQCHDGTTAIAFNLTQAMAAAKGMHTGGSSTNADCLTCHAVGNTLGAPEINPGVNHHGVYSTCDECHPNGHNGTLPDKTNNDFCLTCHTNSGPYAVHHAVAGLSKTCQSCHTIPGVTVPPMTTRDQIVAGCLGCHITTQTGPGGSFAAIYPRVGTPDASQTQDNHHRGSSTKHFVTTTNDYGCKACHGGGKSTAAATGLTGAAFCAECHTVNQTTDHHAGVCLDCHKADGSFTGTFGAGVTSGQNAELDSSCLMCHSTAQGTVGAINPATVSHMTGPNTPASFAESCAKCHNANNVLAGTRSYSGVAPNISATCGQCHDAANYVVAGASLKTPAELAAVADGIHDSAGVNYPVTFSAAVSLKTVTTEAAVSGCGDNCASLTYDWNWGDGVTDAGAGASASHLYATGGTKTIILTVKLNGKKAGASTRNVTITTANANEPPVAAADFTFDANTWTLTVNDHSTDDNQAGLKVLVKWGDGTSKKIAPGATITHKYTRPGTFTAIVRAIDTNQKYTEVTDEVVITKFSISGTVTAADGTTPLAGAKVQLRNPSTNAVVKTMKTLADGSFTTGQTRKPASFKVTVIKKGYTFPTTPVTVGPDADLAITANP